MIWSLLGWLIGSRWGRITAVSVVGLALFLVLLLRAFQKGQSAEKSRQLEASLSNVMKRIAVDEAVRRLPVAVRRDRLREWSRD